MGVTSKKMKKTNWEKENGAGLTGKTVTEERVHVAGTGVSSVTGRSGERSWVGGMFTND